MGAKTELELDREWYERCQAISEQIANRNLLDPEFAIVNEEPFDERPKGIRAEVRRIRLREQRY